MRKAIYLVSMIWKKSLRSAKGSAVSEKTTSPSPTTVKEARAIRPVVALWGSR